MKSFWSVLWLQIRLRILKVSAKKKKTSWQCAKEPDVSLLRNPLRTKMLFSGCPSVTSAIRIIQPSNPIMIRTEDTISIKAKEISSHSNLWPIGNSFFNNMTWMHWNCKCTDSFFHFSYPPASKHLIRITYTLMTALIGAPVQLFIMQISKHPIT